MEPREVKGLGRADLASGSPAHALTPAHGLPVGQAWQEWKAGASTPETGPSAPVINPPAWKTAGHSQECGCFLDVSCSPSSWKQWNATSSLFKISLGAEEWTITAQVLIKKIGLLFPE